MKLSNWEKRPRGELNPHPQANYTLKRDSERWIIHAELAGDIATPGPVVVTGIDGVGKTNLLQRAARLGERNNWVPIQARMEEAPQTLDEVADWMGSQLLDVDLQVTLVRSTILHLLKSWFNRSFSIKFGPSADAKLGKLEGDVNLGVEMNWGKPNPAPVGDAWQTLQRRFQVVGHHCTQKNRGILFLYDNLEELLEAPGGVGLVDFVVESIYAARSAGIPVAGFLALGKGSIQEVQRHYPDFGNRCTLFEVKPLSRPEVSKMIADFKVSELVSEDELSLKTAGQTTLVINWLRILRKGMGEGSLAGPLTPGEWRQTERAVTKSLGEELYYSLLGSAKERSTPQRNGKVREVAIASAL